jgi:hypothetical protein
VTRRGWLLLALQGCWLLGCQREREPRGLVESAEFGVFFGGQVQQLTRIKKQLDPERQRHGFRVSFTKPLPRDVKVAWEIALPATDANAPRPALVGQTTARQGSSVLDVPLAFRPSDPLGAWHAKVTADTEVVIDRDFSVVAP